MLVKFFQKPFFAWLIFFLIFALFAYLRFFNLDKRITFDWDQEQFSNQVKDIIANHKLTLIGPRVVGPEGFFLAPYFIYLLTPFYLISRLHPNALAVFIITYNAVFFLAAFRIVGSLLDRKRSLSFLLLWSVPAIFVSYDTTAWNPIMVPLGVLANLYILKVIYTDQKPFNFLLLGLNLGFFINMHFQFIFIILYSAVFLYFVYRKNPFPLMKSLLPSVAGFASMILPLLFFDFRHNFLNAKLFLAFFLPKAGKIYDGMGWLIVLSDALEPFTFIKNVWLGTGVYIVFAAMFYILAKTKEGFAAVLHRAAFILALLIPLFFLAYGKRPSEYYFNFFYPILLLGLVDFLWTYGRPALTGALFALFVTMSLPRAFNELNTRYTGLYYKDLVVQKIKEKTGANRSTIYFETEPNGDTGFRYLIGYYGLTLEGGGNPTFIIRSRPKNDGDMTIGDFGLEIPPKLRD